MSDSHGLHNKVRVPEGDVLIHAGDCTDNEGRASLRNFLRWFELQPAPRKILIAGNHDWAFQRWPDLARAMVKEEAPSVTYLEDSGCEVDGVKFHGSPYQPEFCNWAFNLPRGPELKRHWDMIPEKTDVLITHGPPFGWLDVSGFDKEKCGCKDLYDAVKRIQPQLHCFGHVHHSYGIKKMLHDTENHTWLINSSICDESYKPTRHPWTFHYEGAASAEEISGSLEYDI